MAQNPHILLVDENTPVREALQRVLRSENFQVVPAASGSEALRKFEENQIDAALIDLNLDRHESGWDVFQALMQRAPLLPIIVMSARSDSFEHASAPAAAARFEKPLNLPKLFCTLEELTKESTALNLNDRQPLSQISQ